MKQVVFYVSLIPIGIVMFVGQLALWLMTIALATGEVCHCLLSRYEHWAFDVPHDYFYNTPYRKTLKQVFKDSYRGVQTGSISA